MDIRIITGQLLDEYTKAIGESPLDKMEPVKTSETPVDYFQFYKSVTSVYSSKIEGEEIDFDSYFKHRFLKVEFKADYTRKADDLYNAYDFIENHRLNLSNVFKAHSILSSNLLPEHPQGVTRNNPMCVINSDDRIEYIAASQDIVRSELEKLFQDIALLLETPLNPFEVFYYASLIHLIFVKIHPFQDGNGRTARLIEKWFLIEKIGSKATAVQLEKNYYTNIRNYYMNIRRTGIEYGNLDYSKSLKFLLMTVQSI